MRQTKPIIYVSGPMTGIEDLNFPMFMQLEEFLLSTGHDVLNPARFGDGGAWADCLKRDIRLLLEADGLVLMPGWENSRGATLEYQVAMGLGQRIGYWTPEHPDHVTWFAKPNVTDNSRPGEEQAPVERDVWSDFGRDGAALAEPDYEEEADLNWTADKAQRDMAWGDERPGDPDKGPWDPFSFGG